VAGRTEGGLLSGHFSKVIGTLERGCRGNVGSDRDELLVGSRIDLGVHGGLARGVGRG
jgi:hypothetical protein